MSKEGLHSLAHKVLKGSAPGLTKQDVLDLIQLGGANCLACHGAAPGPDGMCTYPGCCVQKQGGVIINRKNCVDARVQDEISHAFKSK